VSRPRKAPEPNLHPPCARCHEAYSPAAVWPEGRICTYCYMAAKRYGGTCVICRHQGIVPGITPEGRTCRLCSGITLNVDCLECGAEDELHSNGRCWRCVLKKQVGQTLAGPTGQIPDPLAPLARSLGQMPRPNSGLTWIRQPHALPPSKTVEYIRALLIEHGALPGRDRYLAEFKTWSNRKLTLLTDPAHRSVTERFIRWHQLRRLREQSRSEGTVSSGLFLSAKQSTTVTVNFLNWLTDNGVTLQNTTPGARGQLAGPRPQHTRAHRNVSLSGNSPSPRQTARGSAAIVGQPAVIRTRPAPRRDSTCSPLGRDSPQPANRGWPRSPFRSAAQPHRVHENGPDQSRRRPGSRFEHALCA
jgi:hypothetical protein